MLRDDVINNLILPRLGNRAASATVNSALWNSIIAEMQVAQIELEHMEPMPWFLETIEALTLVANQQNLAVPTGFIMEKEHTSMVLVTPASAGAASVIDPCQKGVYQDLMQNNDLTGTGKPAFYAVVGSNFYFFQTPDVAYTGTLMCYIKDALLTTNVENLWLREHPDLFAAKTCLCLAKSTRDSEIAQLAQPDWDEAFNRYLKFTFMREEMGTSKVLGG